MAHYLLSVDQGTSSSRSILFDEKGDVQALAQKEINLIYPQDGWVEQDPKELVNNTVETIRSVLEKSQDFLSSIAGVGITNQRETTIVWDRKTGEPVYNAIVWQDRRTSSLCATLRGEGLEERIRQKTGLLLDPYFSATKIKWILDHVEGARSRAKNGDLVFGTVDTYLLWHLTGGEEHVTDATNASRTMLYNIVDGKWDQDLFEIFDVPASMAPEVKNNIAIYGQIDSDIVGHKLTVGGMAGDQQSALIGQGCLAPGMIKSTYGTGCFALMNIGDEFIESQNRLLTTIAMQINGKVSYALEGSIFNAGTAIQFLRDNLKAINNAKDSEALALSVPDNGGVYFVPAFTGLGAPYWNPDARGVICGLTRDSGLGHIARATLEAQAFQTRDLVSVMEQDSGHKVESLRADGGLVENKFMCQLIADVLSSAIAIPRVSECTAWGAACLAGVQAGVFDSLDMVASSWRAEHTYRPHAAKEDMDKLYGKWVLAVEKSL